MSRVETEVRALLEDQAPASQISVQADMQP
jgi:hypothetical protein